MTYDVQPMTKRIAHNIKPLTAVIVLLVVGLLLLVVGHWSLVAGAQTPAQVILTWQANNFYPADYAGKALATPNTPVTISVEVLRDGKLLDTSEGTFTWYVDEKLIDRAQGLKEILFTVKNPVGDSHFVRVAIKLENDVFENSTRIPVSEHVVAIEAPYPDKLVRAGSKALLQAMPYFFNVFSLEDLTFSWKINERVSEAGSDNQLILNVGTPQTEAQRTIQIISTVQNSRNFLEFSRERIQLTTF